MLNFKNKIFLLMLLSSISACASSNTKSSWDCKMQSGVGCINIGEADNLSFNSSNKNNSNKCDKSCKKRKKKFLKNLKAKKQKQGSFKEDKEALFLRSSEKVSRVMFSTFIDEQGNKHSESIVYYVDEQSGWVK